MPASETPRSSLSLISPSILNDIPLDIIDKIIANLFDDQDGDNDATLLREFKSLSLVHSYFRSSARKHTHFFDSQRFETAKKLHDYMSFVKDYPGSSIPRCITALDMDLGWVIDPDMHEDATSAFLAWKDHFPNVTQVDLVLNASADFFTKDNHNPVQLVEAMRGIIASPVLQKLTLCLVRLPPKYFSNAGTALKTLQLSSVQSSEGLLSSLSFPQGLDCLRLDSFHDLNHAYEASCRDPELFASIKELSIDDCFSYDSHLWRNSWGFIYSLKDSLQRLELGLGGKVDYSLYPLDILRLAKLEFLIVLMDPETDADAYIPWLSQVFRPLDIIRCHQPNFTLRVMLYPIRVSYRDDQEDLAIFDEWITGFFPPTMSLEVIIQVNGSCDDVEELKDNLRNCEKRCILKVHHE